jgi:hypothetical protein
MRVIGSASAQQLDRDLAVELLIVRRVDDPHAALTELVQQHVVAQSCEAVRAIEQLIDALVPYNPVCEWTNVGKLGVRPALRLRSFEGRLITHRQPTRMVADSRATIDRIRV